MANNHVFSSIKFWDSQSYYRETLTGRDRKGGGQQPHLILPPTWEWLTSYVKIFFQGKGFLPFSDSKNGSTAPLSLICFTSICDLLGFLVFFIPGCLPLGLNFGLYFLFFRFFFLNLSKMAFKVKGLGSIEESLESVSTFAEVTHFAGGFLCFCVGKGTYCVLNKLSDESSLK